MARDGEHFFMCFLAIWTFSIEKALLSSIAHFLFSYFNYFYRKLKTKDILQYNDFQ
jgi:hypothetical protein